MNKSLITLTILFLSVSFVTSQLKPTSFSSEELIVLDPKNVITLVSQQQEELYQKVLRDYLRTFVKENLSSEEIIKQIYQKISSPDAWTNVRNFMIETLFNKFEMNILNESFGAEIRQFPDNYFLTFEMYDLLHD